VLAVYAATFDPKLTPGTMAKTSPPYRPVIDQATDAIQFSNAIEGWHNLVHRNTKRYGAAFSDPRKNIYMRRFWQFHTFIDGKFQAWLVAQSETYDALDHTAV
jgi:hypothetical protein